MPVLELPEEHRQVQQQEVERLSYSARNHAPGPDILLVRVESLAVGAVRKQVQVDQPALQEAERMPVLSAAHRIAVEASELLLAHRSVLRLHLEEALAAALRTLGLDLLQHLRWQGRNRHVGTCWG